jgi:FkbM family methyltransferase
MLSNDSAYQENVINNLMHIKSLDLLPIPHREFLNKLKIEYNFIPNVCYDIGANVLYWTRHAEAIWSDTKIYLFDAFSPCEILYNKYEYTITVLSDVDNKIVQFYQNDFYPGGNSYYRELAFDNSKYFPENNYIEKSTRTLDSIVKEKNYRLPDLIKIDVQGAELDILKGAVEILKHAKFLIVELQSVQYNKDAPLAHVTIDYLKSIGWECIAEKFSDNGPDADYCFINTNL